MNCSGWEYGNCIVENSQFDLVGALILIIGMVAMLGFFGAMLFAILKDW